MMISMK